MVDTFLLLALARTGDQLQGIKKGVLELADVIAVNKADGPHERDARSAARELAGALRLLQPVRARLAAAGADLQRPRRVPGWTRSGSRSSEHRATLDEHRRARPEARRAQQVGWTWAMVRDRLMDRLQAAPAGATAAPRWSARSATAT